MYARIPARLSAALALSLFATVSAAQTPPAAATEPPHQHDQPPADAAQRPAHDMAHTHDEESMWMAPTRTGSGTSWLPDESPMYAVYQHRGPWTLMAHGNAFFQYLRESGDRGDGQGGSINWMMAMADRRVGRGHFGLRGMFSLEAWTIAGCGYPDLLASGETCDGESIHDRQHPHDLFTQLAATYDAPLVGNVRWQVYGGPAAEPALGPVAFPHRLSAMPNPLAPITHHWLDATHVTFGVATGGLYADRWKVEASLFNGREPDDERTDFDFGRLDSWSARAWWLPAPRWALQLSGGHLAEAETAHGSAGRVDLGRLTASATYHRTLPSGGLWASTVAWGRNQESGGEGSHGLLAETNLTLRDRDAWFGRFEWAQKSGHDLDIESDELFGVAKLQASYTRYVTAAKGVKAGVGAGASLGIVPPSLASVYGGRVNSGAAVYFTLRPTTMSM